MISAALSNTFLGFVAGVVLCLIGCFSCDHNYDKLYVGFFAVGISVEALVLISCIYHLVELKLGA